MFTLIISIIFFIIRLKKTIFQEKLYNTIIFIKYASVPSYEFCCHYDRHLVHWKNIVWPSSALRVWRENVQHGRCVWQFSQKASSITRWSTAIVPTLARFSVLVNFEPDEACVAVDKVACTVYYCRCYCLSSFVFTKLFLLCLSAALLLVLLATSAASVTLVLVELFACSIIKSLSFFIFCCSFLCGNEDKVGCDTFYDVKGRFVSLSWGVFWPSSKRTRHCASLISLDENCNVECSAPSTD